MSRSIEAFAGGFIIIDRWDTSFPRPATELRYAGADRYWRKQPVGLTPFATLADAERAAEEMYPPAGWPAPDESATYISNNFPSSSPPPPPSSCAVPFQRAFAGVNKLAVQHRERLLSGIDAAKAAGVAVRAAEEQCQALVKRCLEPGIDDQLVQQLDTLAAFSIVAAACARAALGERP